MAWFATLSSEAAPLCGEVAAEKRPAVRGKDLRQPLGEDAPAADRIIVKPERHDHSAIARCPAAVIFTRNTFVLVWPPARWRHGRRSRPVSCRGARAAGLLSRLVARRPVARPSRALPPLSLQFRKNHPHARPSLLRRGGSGSASAVSAEVCVSAIVASRRASSTSSAVALSATARAAASRYWSVSRAARSPASSAVSRSMSVFSPAVARSAFACACASSPSRRHRQPCKGAQSAPRCRQARVCGVVPHVRRPSEIAGEISSSVVNVLATPPSRSLRRRDITIDLATFHHEDHPLERRDIGQRIAVDRDQIRLHAGRERTGNIR
jgi:hypothetical protein